MKRNAKRRKNVIGVFAITLVIGVAMFSWNCGCVFAQSQHIKSQTDAAGATHPCHGDSETKTKKAKENCCCDSQLEKQAKIPTSVQASMPSGNRLIEMNSLNANAFATHANKKSQRINSARDGTLLLCSQLPLYLTNLSLLI